MYEPTYQQITEEMSRQGIQYPRPEEFSEAEISEAVNDLSDYHLTTDMASLSGKSFSADTLAAFAELANTLDAPVKADASGLKIVRDTTEAERHESAVSNLRSKKYDQQRAQVKADLIARHDMGEDAGQ